MNRILVVYGGRDYTIGNRPLADVEAEIAEKTDSGRSAWIDVNYGAGKPTPCRLLITPGVPIALVDFEKPGAPEQGPSTAS